MFDSLMTREWAHAKRTNKPISLIMLDIDYFKQYNDYYGHIQGDHCLKRVARILTSATGRGRDFVARFGGEEFALVLPETDENAAIRVAEKCRCMILNQRIPHEMSGACENLTVSLGVVTMVPSREADALAFIEKADRLLYKAKENGRNRIEY